jgi:hypothetical protein
MDMTQLIKKSFSGTWGQIIGAFHIPEPACGLWGALMTVKSSKSSMRKVAIMGNRCEPIITLSTVQRSGHQNKGRKMSGHSARILGHPPQIV